MCDAPAGVALEEVFPVPPAVLALHFHHEKGSDVPGLLLVCTHNYALPTLLRGLVRRTESIQQSIEQNSTKL